MHWQEQQKKERKPKFFELVKSRDSYVDFSPRTQTHLPTGRKWSSYLHIWVSSLPETLLLLLLRHSSNIARLITFPADCIIKSWYDDAIWSSHSRAWPANKAPHPPPPQAKKEKVGGVGVERTRPGPTFQVIYLFFLVWIIHRWLPHHTLLGFFSPPLFVSVRAQRRLLVSGNKPG